MGSSALASVESSGADLSSSDVLADPVVSKWFEDNKDIPVDIIDISTSVHHRKIQALRDTAIANMSKLESLAQEKLESTADLRNTNGILQQQVNELKMKQSSHF